MGKSNLRRVALASCVFELMPHKASRARELCVRWRYTRLVRDNDFRVKGRRRLDRMVAAAAAARRHARE